MTRKNNTRSIKAIEEKMLDRIDTRRKLERQHGVITNQPTQGKGWSFIPASQEGERR